MTRSARPSTPDLFTNATAKVASGETQAEPQVQPDMHPSPSRPLLPKDLSGALSRLDDRDIDLLLAAVSEEAKRRGRLPSSSATKSIAPDQLPHDLSSSKPVSAHSRRASARDSGFSLTRG